MPLIESVFPSNESTGVVTGVKIFVIFSEEVDETTLERSIIVTGPDSDRWAGSVLQTFDRPQTPEPEFILDSPGYKGIVKGTFEIIKLDSDNNQLDDPSYSYGGITRKSKVVFTPDDHLAVLTEYTVIINGDELDTDDIKVGIASRTVFDTELGSNTGDGEVEFSGGYTGSIDDKFVVVITTAGNIGTAKYEWYRDSDPLTVHIATTSSHEELLEEGVFVTFDGSGFDDGDQFTARVRVPQYMSGSSTWTFTTGSGSIQTVPDSTSTSVLGDLTGSTSTTTFDVLELTPIHRSFNVSLKTNTIAVEFTDDLDEDTITQDTVKLEVFPARGSFDGNTTDDIGSIPKTLEVDGSTLTIKF